MEYKIGTKYKVLKEGASLSYVNISPETCFLIYKRCDLKPGDIIEYIGEYPIPMLGNVLASVFTKDETAGGMFCPNTYGVVNKGYLELVNVKETPSFDPDYGV